MGRLTFLSTTLVLLACAQLARADVPPPGAEECASLAAGDACGEDGTCQTATCSRPDYQNWDRNASAGPPSIKYDCLLCSDTRPNRGDGDGDGEADGDSKGDEEEDDASRQTPEEKAESESSTTSTAGGKDESSDAGGCSMSSNFGTSFGPWLLAFGTAALVSRRRR